MSALSDALPFDKMRFFRLYTGISELGQVSLFFQLLIELLHDFCRHRTWTRPIPVPLLQLS